MQWAAAVAAGIVLTVGVVLLKPKPAASPEAQVRAVIDEGVAALESADLGGAVSLLSEAYKDRGGRSKDNLKGLAFMALRRGPVFIALTNVAITIEGTADARAVVQGVALQGAPDVKAARDLLPKDGRAFDVTLTFVRDDDDWRVTSIEGLSASLFN